MSDTTTNARKVLKRLLANGPLIAMPKRPRDAELLLGLDGEHEVNELLQAWLETISAPYGIDHVSLRRHLVDAQFLMRDASGSTYRVSVTKARPAVDIDPAQVLADIRRDREARKRQHAK
jgi:hypothetical protein